MTEVLTQQRIHRIQSWTRKERET